MEAIHQFLAHMTKEAQVGPQSFNVEEAERLAKTLGGVPEPDWWTKGLSKARDVAHQYPRAVEAAKWVIPGFGSVARGASDAYRTHAQPQIDQYGRALEGAVKDQIMGPGEVGWTSTPGIKANAKGVELGARTLIAPEKQLQSNLSPADYQKVMDIRRRLTPAQQQALTEGGARLMRSSAAVDKEIVRRTGLWWDANKSWLVPAGITLAAVLGMGAIALWPRQQQPQVAQQLPPPQQPQDTRPAWLKDWQLRSGLNG